MTFALLGITFALVLTGAVLVTASFRSTGDDAGLLGMIGLSAAMVAAIPAVVYAGITG
ncbi:hypothetical protein [Jatrophihabitans sp.]|uniref:hypothetical protein n=1 Tax=Jatrophihabitans sp. TaxID=1932789 RepID=UPI002B58674E|nr:hypothetical protein [Jatrophihabitans sp.]